MEKSLESTQNEAGKKGLGDLVLRIFTVLILLYFFLVGVSALGGSFKMMGAGFAKTLFGVSSHPIIGLFAGMLATALIQSSSATTSIIVGLVASGTLPIGGAVPMIMGANLGTSVTNTIVSLAYIKDTKNYRNAFSAATVHDIFNFMAVAIMLPIEIMTGFLQKSAVTIANALYGSAAGFKFKSPIKAAIKPAAKSLKAFCVDTFGAQGSLAGIILLIISALIILVALSMVVKTMKVIVEEHKGEIVEKLLAKNPYFAILFGTLLTISVQSSSITTSLLIPMAGSGMLTLASIYPVTIGANLGTTTTALLAALAGNVHGLAIALVHLLFNLSGFLIFFPIKRLRRIPVDVAAKLGELVEKRRVVGLAYIAVVFFLLPLGLIFI